MSDPLNGQSDSDEVIEIRCLWSKTDYGYVSLLAAARGFGGRTLGSYQDQVTDEKFARIRGHEHECNPDWPVAESIIKVAASSVEALFPGVLTTNALPSEAS